MNITNLVGGLPVTIAVLLVGFALYQQNERHFAESQRWLGVCLKQFEVELQQNLERTLKDDSLPEEVREQAKLGIDAWDQDYLYSKCYKEWHGGR